jgi:hypothetical protein
MKKADKGRGRGALAAMRGLMSEVSALGWGRPLFPRKRRRAHAYYYYCYYYTLFDVSVWEIVQRDEAPPFVLSRFSISCLLKRFAATEYPSDSFSLSKKKKKHTEILVFVFLW